MTLKDITAVAAQFIDGPCLKPFIANSKEFMFGNTVWGILFAHGRRGDAGKWSNMCSWYNTPIYTQIELLKIEGFI